MFQGEGQGDKVSQILPNQFQIELLDELHAFEAQSCNREF